MKEGGYHMTVADHMKIMGFRFYGMREAEAEACIQHVIQELNKDSLFQEYLLRFGDNYWQQPIQNFQGKDLDFCFRLFVLPLALRWMTYQYYDAIDGE
jgi:hypothetical protein